jgi:hypothetical protein
MKNSIYITIVWLGLIAMAQTVHASEEEGWGGDGEGNPKHRRSVSSSASDGWSNDDEMMFTFVASSFVDTVFGNMQNYAHYLAKELARGTPDDENRKYFMRDIESIVLNEYGKTAIERSLLQITVDMSWKERMDIIQKNFVETVARSIPCREEADVVAYKFTDINHDFSRKTKGKHETFITKAWEEVLTRHTLIRLPVCLSDEGTVAEKTARVRSYVKIVSPFLKPRLAEEIATRALREKYQVID